MRWTNRAKLTLAVAVAAVAIGCVGGGSKGPSPEEKDKLKAYILTAPPANMAHPVDVNFENKIHLIGYKFDPETAKPGTKVKLTYWWRCDEQVDDGWQLFTHIHEEANDKSDNLDGVGSIREKKHNDRQVLGPDQWEKGRIYVDEQDYTIPDWVKGPDLTILVGIWNVKGGEPRLKIVSGPNDGDNRSPIGKIKTGLTQGPPPEAKPAADLPALSAAKLAAGDKIVIDGKGDDKAWATAASTGAFVDVGSGKPNSTFPVNATAKVAWDDTNLYVLYEVKEADIVGYFTSKDKQAKDWTTAGQPKLWTKDTVELMVDPEGDNKDYYEIQINPQNKQFKTRYDSYNAPKTEPDGPFGHEDWNPKIQSAVVVKGAVDGKDSKVPEAERGYTVEAAIPWAVFDKVPVHPPKAFDTWRINLYAMKNNSGVAWSPILGQGNFHKASRFGKVTWNVPGMTPPAASAQPPADSADPNAPDGGPPARKGIRPMIPHLPHPPVAPH